VNCTELTARLDSQKIALLKIEANEIAKSASNGSFLYAEYLEAKANYERAARLYSSLSRGVRG
jgi:hypothetical protein